MDLQLVSLDGGEIVLVELPLTGEAPFRINDPDEHTKEQNGMKN